MVHYFFQNFLFFSGLPLPDEGNCAVLLFRFQNVRSPKYSAFWALAPDGQASRSPSAKDRLPGWRPPVFEAEYKGLLTFFHSHSQTRQAMHLCPAVSGKPGCSVPKGSRTAEKVYERYL